MTLIQSGSWNAERLAAELKTTVRNVYRDLKMLEGAGIPYYYDAESASYRMSQRFFMPPVDLTVPECLALVAAASQIGGRDQVPFLKPLEQAAQKIVAQLPEALKEHLVDAQKHMAIELARYGPSEEVRDVYDRVRVAIEQRRALRCLYESGRRGRNHDGEAFVFEPYCLFWGQRAWYAVGFHHGRGEVRTLKLNRFSRVQTTDRPYAIPDDFSMRGHLGKAWRMIRGDRTYKVEVQFDAAFAENVTETIWHETQKVEEQDDGSVLMRFEVDGLDEIVWWILSMGPHCRVRRPAILARQVRDLASRTAEAYGGEGSKETRQSASEGKAANKGRRREAKTG